MSKMIRGFAAAALLLALPLSVNAQEQQEEGAPQQEVCEATVAPIHSGEIVAAAATFASPFGDVVAIEAPEESGLALASEEERTQLAAEQSEKLTELASQPNTSIFWVDARGATAGTYVVMLKNAEQVSCVAEITVEDPAGR
jgi:hypothetical protein